MQWDVVGASSSRTLRCELQDQGAAKIPKLAGIRLKIGQQRYIEGRAENDIEQRLSNEWMNLRSGRPKRRTATIPMGDRPNNITSGYHVFSLSTRHLFFFGQSEPYGMMNIFPCWVSSHTWHKFSSSCTIQVHTRAFHLI